MATPNPTNPTPEQLAQACLDTKTASDNATAAFRIAKKEKEEAGAALACDPNDATKKQALVAATAAHALAARVGGAAAEAFLDANEALMGGTFGVPAGTVPAAAPAAPGVAPTTTIATGDIERLIKAAGTKTAASYPPPKKPRVGGVSSIGAWTGRGAGNLGKVPRNGNCMRAFQTEPIKNFVNMNVIHDKCKAGLPPEFQFCLTNESNAGLFVPCLQKLETHMKDHGLEGVMEICYDNIDIKMLESPGSVDPAEVKTWIQRVTVDGVPLANGVSAAGIPYSNAQLPLCTQRPVCGLVRARACVYGPKLLEV
ncbi:MAG: hypothetical protein SGPRY_011834 [Prymnesium sp.]